MIRISFVFLSVFSLVSSGSKAELSFRDHFVDRTMRIDYHHMGNSSQEFITIDRIYQQNDWAGNPDRLFDEFGVGRYAIKIFDAASGKLIFSKGFDSYFGEYKTTDRAVRGEQRTFHESALIPYPKKKIRFAIERKNRKNQLVPMFRAEIDPASIDIIREPLTKGVKVFHVVKGGHPHKNVDVAILAEGYTKSEEEKFSADLDRTVRVLFSQEPYRSNRDRFNIYGLFKPSQQSGCDQPRRGIYRNTSLGASFNTLGIDRYMLTDDNRAVRDVAAHVPYDTLVIMVNSDRYGGGGIYNLYCTLTSDNRWHPYILLHELGHSFGGLADEYYTSEVTFSEFYPPGIEPAEPNISALLNPEKLKWKTLVTKGVTWPTQWEKRAFENLEGKYQKRRKELNQKIAALSRKSAPPEKIKAIEKKLEHLTVDHASNLKAFFAQSAARGKVGAFLGAGYSSEGLYRPMVDCIMFTKGVKPYCRVCQQAILRRIQHLSTSTP